MRGLGAFQRPLVPRASRRLLQVGYSCYYYDDDANTELLVAGCPMTCGACECVDTEGYEDPWAIVATHAIATADAFDMEG